MLNKTNERGVMQLLKAAYYAALGAREPMKQQPHNKENGAQG
jgi:hypothetical protein